MGEERENVRSALFEILEHQYGPDVIHPYTISAIEDLFENQSELTRLREENERMREFIKGIDCESVPSWIRNITRHFLSSLKGE